MKNKFSFLVLTISFNSMLLAQKVIPLYDSLAPNSKDIPGLTDSIILRTGSKTHSITRVAKPEITLFLPDLETLHATSLHPAVIICPGGGYNGLAIDHEGYDIAKKLNEHGIVGIVLKYRLPKSQFVENKEIVPLQDAQRAIQLVRMNAKAWGINPNKVGILGNSAGGHVASMAGTHFLKEKIDNPNHISLRPDFMVLNYPVISFADSIAHLASRYNLISGELPYEEVNRILGNASELKKAVVSQEKIIEYSNELQVTTNTPPTFITHSVDDKTVPVQNSLLFIAALQKNKVPVESFFYAKGGHGYGMYNPTSDVNWIDRCIEWILKMKSKK